MELILKFLRVLLALPFMVIMIVLLLLYPLINSASSYIANKNNLTGLLDRSGIYENALDISFENFTQQTESGTELRNIANTVSDPNTDEGKILKEVITPEYLRSSAKTAINATYSWLEGKTATPDFEIRIFKDEAQFDRGISLMIMQKINGLPPCTGPVSVSNPFELQCKPPGFSVTQVEKFLVDLHSMPQYQELYSRSIIQSNKFIKMTPEESKRIQLGYFFISWMPVFSSVILLLFVALVLLLLPSQRAKYYFVGGVVCIFPLMWVLAIYLSNAQISELITNWSSTVKISPSAIEIMRVVINDFRSTMEFSTIIYAIILSLAGVVIAFLPMIREMLKKKNVANTHSTSKMNA